MDSDTSYLTSARDDLHSYFQNESIRSSISKQPQLTLPKNLAVQTRHAYMDSPKDKSKMSTSSSKSSHSALQPQLQEQAKQLRNTVKDPLATRPRSRTSGPHEVLPGDIFAESRSQEDMKSNQSGSGDENAADERWMLNEGEGKAEELKDKKYVDLASPPCYAPRIDEY